LDTDPLPEFFISNIILLTDLSSVILSIFALIILIILSALISGSEVAFFSLASKQLISLEEENNKRSDRIIKLLQQPRKLLATILISNNFINIAIVVFSTVFLQKILPDSTFISWGKSLYESVGFFSAEFLAKSISFLITIVLVTFILVLFGEITPKILANMHNMAFAKRMSLPLTFLQKGLSPLSLLLVNFTQKIEDKLSTDQRSADRKDIDRAIDLAVNLEDSPEEELDMLKGILKFGDISTKQIMKPRVDVTALDITDDFTEVLKVARDSGYSRIPVEKEDFDNVVGILYIKDLLGFTTEDSDFKWQEHIRKEILYIPETKKINELLREFQLKRMHMGIVVDEYGGSGGIVTLEDIMEEVLGDIKDEFDQLEEVEYQKIDDRNYIFEGKTLINDMARIMDLEIDIFDKVKGDADSMAGLLLELVGYIPKEGEEFEYENYKFKIVAANKRRIENIQIELPEINDN